MKTSYPVLSCDPGGTQTRDLRNRNPTFYSTKLRSQILVAKVNYFSQSSKFICKFDL